MKKANADEAMRIGLNEIIAAILGEEDVSGVTMIMPGQPVMHIAKMDVEKQDERKVERWER